MVTVGLELARLREGFPAAPLELKDKPKEKKKKNNQKPKQQKNLSQKTRNTQRVVTEH